jgi:hypothetical protein
MKRATSILLNFLGAWLVVAALAAPALADAGPGCGSKDHDPPPPRDGSVGYHRPQRPQMRMAGGGLVLLGGLASIWASSRRRGG